MLPVSPIRPFQPTSKFAQLAGVGSAGTLLPLASLGGKRPGIDAPNLLIFSAGTVMAYFGWDPLFGTTPSCSAADGYPLGPNTKHVIGCPPDATQLFFVCPSGTVDISVGWGLGLS
jgi:hypothetical protein